MNGRRADVVFILHPSAFILPTVAEVGVEPTINHQALDLAALPVCVLGQANAPSRGRRLNEISTGSRTRT